VRNYREKFVFLLMLFLIMNGSLVYGQQISLWGSQKEGTVSSGPVQAGNTIKLTADARIAGVLQNADSMTVFRNGEVYVTVKKGRTLIGTLPPGEYNLRTSIGSASIQLDMNFRAEKIILWGRQTALVEPRQEGNIVVLSTATTIVDATYDGTAGMGLFRINDDPHRAFLLFTSPHNLKNPGPKVTDMTGAVMGKTLVGLTLPAGVYSLTPGRGTADGAVFGQVVLNAAAGGEETLSEILVSGSYRVDTWYPHHPSTWTLQIVKGHITGMSKWTCCPGPRNDPLIGRIDGNTVTLTRDCTGQGHSGPCSQIYTGTLKGNVIEGSFTHNGPRIGTWKLYLDSRDDPSLTVKEETAPVAAQTTMRVTARIDNSGSTTLGRFQIPAGFVATDFRAEMLSEVPTTALNDRPSFAITSAGGDTVFFIRRPTSDGLTSDAPLALNTLQLQPGTYELSPGGGRGTSVAIEFTLSRPTVAAVPQGSVAARSLHPVADTHVYAYEYSGWNKANWGAYDRLGAGWHPTGGEKRTYLRFDLAGVDPARAKTATLRLFHHHTGGGNALTLGVYRVTGPWIEGRGTYKPSTPAGPGEICWVHQPSVDSSPAAQFHLGPGVDKWVEVDVTPLVRAWLSGTPNHGLMIKAQGALSRDTPHAEYGFYSREGDAGKRPVLVLSDGPATPPAADVPQNFDQAVARLCAPDEDFVRSLYHCITHREPTAQEVREQIERLRAGAPRQHMIANFFASPGYVNQNHDGVRFMTDACQAIYARPPTAAELGAWPRTHRKTIVDMMLKDPAHLAATKDCAALWRKEPAGDPPAVVPDKVAHTSTGPALGQDKDKIPDPPKMPTDKWADGQMLLAGQYKLTETWTTASGELLSKGLYWTGGFYLPAKDRKYVNWDPTVQKLVAPRVGTLTLQGPGKLLVKRFSRGAYLMMRHAETKGRQLFTEYGADYRGGEKWHPVWNGYLRDKDDGTIDAAKLPYIVPKGQKVTINVYVEATSYNNVMNTGEFSFHAPQSLEYEVWWFPMEGGKTLSVTRPGEDGKEVDVIGGKTDMPPAKPQKDPPGDAPDSEPF